MESFLSVYTTPKIKMMSTVKIDCVNGFVFLQRRATSSAGILNAGGILKAGTTCGREKSLEVERLELFP